MAAGDRDGDYNAQRASLSAASQITLDAGPYSGMGKDDLQPHATNGG